MILVSIAQQCLLHRRAGVWHRYQVSSAMRGAGQQENSLQTPLGRHRLVQKIGEGLPLATVFRARKPVGLYRQDRDDPQGDWILARILRLQGEQTGFNRRGSVDSFRRYIYIHGSHAVAQLGQPASHGCIRMHPEAIAALFDDVHVGERLIIRLAPMPRVSALSFSLKRYRARKATSWARPTSIVRSHRVGLRWRQR